jgi:hypothetical protein
MGSTAWYSRQQYMPSRHALWRIKKRHREVGTFIFHLIAEWPLKYLTVSRKTTKQSGIVISIW